MSAVEAHSPGVGASTTKGAGKRPSGLREGALCYMVMMRGLKVEFWEWELRTIRTNKGRLYGYWWAKLPGVTWGKLSPKAGHYGWLPGASPDFRVKHLIEKGRPYGATKRGALRKEISDIRAEISDYGVDSYSDDEDETNGHTLGERLKAMLGALARQKG